MRTAKILLVAITGAACAYLSALGLVAAAADPMVDAEPNPDRALYTYRARINEIGDIYDGDTFTCDIDLGCRVWLHGEKVRVLGIDTPELRGGTAETKRRGIEARDAVRAMLDLDLDGKADPGSQLILRTEKADAFGRRLARVWVRNAAGGWTDLAAHLIAKNHAEPYAR